MALFKFLFLNLSDGGQVIVQVTFAGFRRSLTMTVVFWVDALNGLQLGFKQLFFAEFVFAALLGWVFVPRLIFPFQIIQFIFQVFILLLFSNQLIPSLLNLVFVACQLQYKLSCFLLYFLLQPLDIMFQLELVTVSFDQLLPQFVYLNRLVIVCLCAACFKVSFMLLVKMLSKYLHHRLQKPRQLPFKCALQQLVD